MCAPIGVIFDPFDEMLSRCKSLVVDYPYPPLVAATTVPHCDSARVVSSTEMLAFLGEGELEMGPAFPEMVVDGSLEMSQTGCAWLVGLQWDEHLSAGASFGGCSSATGDDTGLKGRRRSVVDDGGIGADGRQHAAGQAGLAKGAYPRLQHRALMSLPGN
jgi:hypothetical protein